MQKRFLETLSAVGGMGAHFHNRFALGPMPLLTELDWREDGLGYKHDAPDGACRRKAYRIWSASSGRAAWLTVCLNLLLFFITAAPGAGQSWQAALSEMPLAAGVTWLDRTNCVEVMLNAFQ